MDIHELIRIRKSVRSYLPKPVEPEKLEKIFHSVRLAPSANNRQEWRFILVQDKETRRLLKTAAANQSFVEEAPVVLACCAETDGRYMRCGIESYKIDVAIAVDHLTLAAAAEGLGTCWVGAFYPDQVREILHIPPAIEVVELLTLGYPKDPGLIEKERLPLEKILYKETWKR
ncbi:MAG: nitroreductase family protein [Spirochaetales bacterium]|nr:nitroreductase family protein [Spirochaetales bacterium]